MVGSVVVDKKNRNSKYDWRISNMISFKKEYGVKRE
jgi:hypothetical protein